MHVDTYVCMYVCEYVYVYTHGYTCRLLRLLLAPFLTIHGDNTYMHMHSNEWYVCMYVYTCIYTYLLIIAPSLAPVMTIYIHTYACE